ncbi:MAG: Glu-tRNA(Gln) amidotransferase subunit GatD, partial [Candidatus Thorarchaeota archaeon]
MSNEKYTGYKSTLLNWLKTNNLEVWDEVEIQKGASKLKGVILPRNELADPRFVSLKLLTGYNIGFNPKEIQSIKKYSHFKGKYQIPKRKIIQNPELPFIPILGCGGTIASRLDYQTGGTIPVLTPEELFSSFPEIADVARIETQLLFDIFSENITFSHYIEILTAIETTIKNKNPKGIVLTHGTDTMAYTAAALSFSITNSPIPIVITGSQRSSDRPSSDAFLNLYNSVLYAASPQAKNGIVVIMHEESSDTSSVIHMGTRIRKMHSSRRNTFRTVGKSPIGRITDGVIQYFTSNDKHMDLEDTKQEKDFIISNKFEEKIGLIYHYPGIQPELIDHYIKTGYKGIVFAGTGLGHVSSYLIPSIKKAIDDGIIVVMTTQCLYGFTGLSVYESGRQL